MTRFREPLVIPCCAFACGILASHYARFDWTEWPVLLSLGAILALVGRRAAPRLEWLAWACCACAAGIAVAEAHRPGRPPRIDAPAGELLVVGGCVVEPLSIRDGRGRFTIEIEPGARAAVSARIDPGDPIPNVRYGTKVEFEGRVRSPRNYANPGAFDYVGYLARRNTYWLISVRNHSAIQTVAGRCGSSVQQAIEAIRSAALQRLDGLFREDTGFLRALLLGDEERLDPATSEDFRKTGTYHAIVISGLHISLVAGSILWLLRHAFFPGRLRFVISALAAWAYTLLAGGQAPVMRAAVGFTLGLVAMASYRRARVLNILAAVAIAFLVADPGQLFEASFQLSFAAVAAIGALASPLLERTSAILRAACRKFDRVRPNPSEELSITSLRVELRLVALTIQSVFGTKESLAKTAVLAPASMVAAVWDMTVLSVAVQFALTVPAILLFPPGSVDIGSRKPFSGSAAEWRCRVRSCGVSHGFACAVLVCTFSGSNRRRDGCMVCAART